MSLHIWHVAYVHLQMSGFVQRNPGTGKVQVKRHGVQIKSAIKQRFPLPKVQSTRWFSVIPMSVTLLGVALTTGCAHQPEPEGPLAKETVFAITADHVLISFNAGQPGRVLSSKPVQGLIAGDQLIGMDFRVAKGVLHALSRKGQLYTLDTASAQLKPVGAGNLSVPLRGDRYGVDFNPAADRVRVISDAGQSMRLHPDTGAQVDFDAAKPGVQTDPDVTFAVQDSQHGHSPQLVAAAYTYNNKDEKITTNYVLDARLGTLVMQGSREGAVTVESPNLGVLRTVGALGVGPLVDAAFDISDVRNTALAALRTRTDQRTRLYKLDLSTGQATLVGTIAKGEPLVGMAIEP